MIRSNSALETLARIRRETGGGGALSVLARNVRASRAGTKCKRPQMPGNGAADLTRSGATGPEKPDPRPDENACEGDAERELVEGRCQASAEVGAEQDARDERRQQPLDHVPEPPMGSSGGGARGDHGEQ